MSSERVARFVAHGARRVRRNRLALLAPWLVDAAIIVASLVTRTPLVLVGLVHGTILGGVLSAYVYSRNPWAKLEDVEVAADAEGVWFDGQLAIPRKRIKQGFVYEQDGRWRVRLQRGRLSDEIAVPDEATGRGLLTALGLDASQTVAQFRVMSPFFGWSGPRKFGTIAGGLSAWIVIATLVAKTIGGRAAPIAFAVGELVMIMAMLVLFFPAKLFVGRDGLLRRWLGRTTFVPIGKIAAVTPCSSSGLRSSYIGAQVHLEGGPDLKLYVGQKKWSDAQAAMLVDRIEQVLEGRARGGTIPFEASALRRGDRDLTSWIQSLRALGAGARDDLRSTPADLERLLRLVEDPAARPIDRAAAAVALPRELPLAERDRVRIAAASTAEPHLRIALEKVAEGEPEDAAIAESLAELDAETGGALRADAVSR